MIASSARRSSSRSSSRAASPAPLTLDSEIVLVSVGSSYDEDGFEDGGWSSHVSRKTVAELVTDHVLEVYEDAVDALVAEAYDLHDLHEEKIFLSNCCVEVSDLEGFLSDWKDYLSEGDGWHNVYTEAEFSAMQAEEERKKIEQSAAAFAAHCGHPVASRDYIRALRATLNRTEDRMDGWNSGESRMERFADSRFSGQSMDGYYCDEDYAQQAFGNQLAHLERVEQWLSENCPLLMASMREEELAS